MLPYRTLNTLIILILAVALAACSDSGTSGISDDDPPEPMNVEDIQMNIEIFQQVAKATPDSDIAELSAEFSELLRASTKDEHMTPYEFAGLWATTADAMFQSFAGLPNVWFNDQMWGEPELDGDTWIWEFSESVEGESVTVVVTAEESEDMILWELRYSMTTQDGPNFEDMLLMSADLRQDGTSGNWTIYQLMEDTSENQPSVDFEFLVEDGLTTFLEIGFSDEVGDNFDDVLYEVVDAIASLTYFQGGEVTTYIEWNRDSWEGFIESDQYNDGNRACWDGNLQTIEC